MSSPLVTVICLCYNHERFVLEAMESVVAQSHGNFQLIVVDDASTDRSRQIISDFVRSWPGVQFVAHESNLGNCKAFNSGLALARGEFVMDFSADDVLPTDRLEVGVQEFAKHGDSFGVQFGDALLIDEAGKILGHHSDRFPHASIPQGDIYEQLIRRYFVCGPSTMVRKRVLDEMGGYDEQLAYEDFDFWIRSSRNSKYFYTPRVLVKRRIVRGSLNEKQFTRRSSHAWSTLAVCKKILALNRTQSEQSALTSRIFYELRQCIKTANFRLANQYAMLFRQNWSWMPGAQADGGPAGTKQW